jgi:hypothetical protein
MMRWSRRSRAHRAAASRTTVARCPIFTPLSQALQLVADLRASGRIAVVFSRPTTHRTLQLKADDARVRNATPDEAAIVADYVDAFAREIGIMGHTAEQACAMFQFARGRPGRDRLHAARRIRADARPKAGSRCPPRDDPLGRLDSNRARRRDSRDGRDLRAPTACRMSRTCRRCITSTSSTWRCRTSSSTRRGRTCSRRGAQWPS